MKKIQGLFFTLILVSFALAPLACNKPYTLGPLPPPSPTPAPTLTATPNLTPVCGFTQIGLGSKALNAGPSVIRGLADWNTFCSYPTGMVFFLGTPTPTPPSPPVDFATQMIILYITPVCPMTTLQVTNVCEGPAQITVYANSIQSCVQCNVAASWGAATGLVVSQSNLPVVWNYTNVPCSGF